MQVARTGPKEIVGLQVDYTAYRFG
jgi:hypothetical protein